MSKVKIRRVKPPTRLLAVLLLTLVSTITFICLTSCNVTRKVITQSEYLQKGDTNVVIITKSIESYDAIKKFIDYETY